MVGRSILYFWMQPCFWPSINRLAWNFKDSSSYELAMSENATIPALAQYSNTDHSAWLLVASYILIFVSVLVTAVRILWRFRIMRTLLADDWLILAATVSCFSYLIFKTDDDRWWPSVKRSQSRPLANSAWESMRMLCLQLLMRNSARYVKQAHEVRCWRQKEHLRSPDFNSSCCRTYEVIHDPNDSNIEATQDYIAVMPRPSCCQSSMDDRWNIRVRFQVLPAFTLE